MSRLYGLTQRTATRLTRKLDEVLRVGGRGRSSPAARGVTWVKVTGAASGGWHPGVVSLDADGTFTDLAAAVEVKALDGGTLATNARYLATRTKNKADGTARFRAAAWSYTAQDFPSATFTPSDDFWNDVTGCSITIPEAGRYRVEMFIEWSANALTVPVGPLRGRIRIDSTDYSAVTALQVQVASYGCVGTAFYGISALLAAGAVCKLQALRSTGSGSWTSCDVSTNSHIRATRE